MKKIILVLLLVPFLSYGQQKYNPKIITKSTDKVVKEIKKINELMDEAVYYEGMRPKQYDNFEKLKKIASKEELIELTNHPNGVVRCYAFWALSYNKSVDLFPIVLNHINDDKLVKTQFGCIGSQEMVGDFFISIITPQYVDWELTKFDSVQREQLDSILIYSDSKLYAKSKAIRSAKPTESLYPKIRELYIKENNQPALVTLAKYKKLEDIPLILNNEDKYRKYENYFYTYKAILEFPHEDFLPLLEKKLYETLDDEYYSNEWSILYQAIAKYKNAKAIELLTVPFTQVKHEDIREYHMEFVYNAIRNNKDEMYDSLLWKLWSEENIITPGVFQYLLEKDSIKVLELTKKNMANIAEINYLVNYASNLDTKESMISMMLNFIKKNDYELGLEIIRENIKSTHVHQMPIFTDKVMELKDSSFVEPLFERLAKEWNAHVYLAIAEALLSYQDDAINKRILQTRKTNDNLNKGWGSEDLDELLNKINQITK